MIDQKWIDETMAEFAKACPLSANDSEAVAALTEKVRKYDEHLGCPPPIGTIISLARPYETALQQKRDDAAKAEQDARDRLNARRQARADFLSDVGVSRENLVQEFRERNLSEAQRQTFKPDREYSQSEIDAMPDAEAKRVLFGIEDFGLNKQDSANEYSVQTTRTDVVRRPPKLKESTRQQLEAEEYRARVIKKDKEERRKIQEDLRSALGGKK